MRNAGTGRRVRPALIGAVVALVALAAAGTALSKSVRGQLYMFTKSTTLSARVGTPCQADEDTAERAYCDKTFHCKDGQVARGMTYNVSVVDGVGTLTGVGLVCTEPNELLLTEQIGAVGAEFGGEAIRDACDTGFFLTGMTAATTDRRNVTGVRRQCRRYWPVAEQQGANEYGSGVLREWTGCPDGRFVTGMKVSYFQNADGSGVDQTIIRNLRFYCSEMRHWIGEPEDLRDPRDPATRK